jgi:hypothetical protein
LAVSPESIVESVPKELAQNTSVTSARVGIGNFSIESSICVATIIGFPSSRHLAIMYRSQYGTS